MTAWSHLPNAKHIDRIIADLKKNPGAWGATQDTAWIVTQDTAWNAAWTAARITAMAEERIATWGVAYDSVYDITTLNKRNSAWGAILALIAYDDCAYLFDEKIEHVQMLALLGNEQAILLYPACVAMQKEKT